MQINEIQIPETVAGSYEGSEPGNTLKGIRRLNCLIGPNNSGKSRLMRAMFEEGRQIIVAPEKDPLSSLRKEFVSFISEAKSVTDQNGDLAKAVRHFPDTLGMSTLQGEWKIGKNDSDTTRAINRLRAENSETLTSLGNKAHKLNSHEGNKPPAHRSQLHAGDQMLFRTPLFVYAPTLRGMRLPSAPSELRTAYHDRTVSDYFDSKTNFTPRLKSVPTSQQMIVTGLDLYETLTDHLLGTPEERELVRAFEKFLGDTFFEGKEIALTPRRGDDTLHVKVGDEAERPIQQLGDGLQQIITLTFPLYQTADRPLFYYIEEPDLFLHPGFQQVLIETILNDPRDDLFVFVTTHSAQFLDITLDEKSTAIFRCGKSKRPVDASGNSKFKVERAGYAQKELLNHIGVRPSSLMFANCTIWVEGITDRLYFGKMLQLLCAEIGKTLVENLHFAFVEYGGSNITHWSFLDEEEGMEVERICSELFLITDRDEKKEERHSRLEAALGDRFYRLNCMEVENLLTPEVIKAVIQSYEKGAIGMNHFTQSRYKNTRIGSFIDRHVLIDLSQSRRHRQSKGKSKNETAYAEASGTIRDKPVFCRKALKEMQSFEDLSPEAQDIARRLFNFIVGKNGFGWSLQEVAERPE